ncbi:MAG: 5-bromo-4-chloroindolyl phosphate hydrolysis family protein [Lactovum sp.]
MRKKNMRGNGKKILISILALLLILVIFGNSSRGGILTEILTWLIILAIFSIFISICIWIIKQLLGTKERKKEKTKLENYKEAGLSDSEIDLFRETMSEAKQQILFWDKQQKKHIDLSVIEDVTSGLESSKKLFQLIVKDPQELTKQNKFLYKDLPNMVKLIESYDKLVDVSLKEDENLKETLLLIKTLSSQIAENYQDFLMKDIKIIEKEVQNA